ncbi:MAG: hypothetical protein R2748_16585 [Bryobacterales bacterium]
MTETIEVTGAAPIMHEEASVGEVVDSQEARRQPVNQRLHAPDPADGGHQLGAP